MAPKSLYLQSEKKIIMLHDFLFNRSKAKDKSNFYWNAIAGLLNAAKAVILLAIVTRLCGIEEAGYLSIAFAVGNLFIAIGKYGVRTFQVTQNTDELSISAYRNARILSTMLMAVACCIYILCGILFNQYSWYKVCIVSAMCVIYLEESMEDVYWGDLQRRGNLAAGAKVFILRWGVILIVVLTGLFCGLDLLIALWIAVGLSTTVYILCVRTINIECHNNIKLSKDWKKAKFILKQCTPLALAIFFQYYLSNAPKYTIDSLMSDDMQAIYGYLSMPVFVVQLFSEFIYQPMLADMAIEWNEGRFDKFGKYICRQCLVIAGLIFAVAIGADILGVKILSMIYGVDLADYRVTLVILMTGGGFLAANTFFRNVLTIMDKRNKILWSYGISALVMLAVLNGMIEKRGIFGAALAYLLIMLILGIYFGTSIGKVLRQRRRMDVNR